MADNDTFVRVTNRDVYQAIMDLKRDTEQRDEETRKEIVKLQVHVAETNGKVKRADLQLKGLWTVLTFLAAVIVWILQNMTRG